MQVCLTQGNRNSAENQAPDIQVRPKRAKHMSKLYVYSLQALLADVNGMSSVRNITVELIAVL